MDVRIRLGLELTTVVMENADYLAGVSDAELVT